MHHQPPIIALWAHPRSMSTATERIMRERGDCKVFHEPFLPYYYLQLKAANMPMLDTASIGPTEYEPIRNALYTAAEKTPVFFKDMSYFVIPRLFQDELFSRRLFNLFLIRDPRRSIASYYKLDPDVTQIEIGLDAQWRHYQYLVEKFGVKPLVISAESLAHKPKDLMRIIWQHIGLPYIDKAFNWQPDAAPHDWNFVQGWHQSTTASTGMMVDQANADEVFTQACVKAPHLQDYLDFHWPAYQQLRALAL